MWIINIMGDSQCTCPVLKETISKAHVTREEWNAMRMYKPT